MEDDPYGFCHHLDREAVKVLDKKGLKAFVVAVRSKYEAAADNDSIPEYQRRQWAGALKTVLAAQRDIDGYVALCEETELEAKDCKVIAEIYKKRRKPADALSWVKRGLEIARSDKHRFSDDHDLNEMKRELLTKLGRSEDALASAWAQYEANPHLFYYKELMRYVPAKKKKEWQQKAMTVSDTADLHAQMEIWLDTKETDRLVARLRKAADDELEGMSHYHTEPVAKKLKPSHPDIAARIYRALCMRIVNAGKSKYYDAALDNLEDAKKCYEKAGLAADWEAVVADIRGRHSRKSGFMAGFEDIVSGEIKPPEPTFMERARGRWPRR